MALEADELVEMRDQGGAHDLRRGLGGHPRREAGSLGGGHPSRVEAQGAPVPEGHGGAGEAEEGRLLGMLEVGDGALGQGPGGDRELVDQEPEAAAAPGPGPEPEAGDGYPVDLGEVGSQAGSRAPRAPGPRGSRGPPRPRARGRAPRGPGPRPRRWRRHRLRGPPRPRRGRGPRPAGAGGARVRRRRRRWRGGRRAAGAAQGTEAQHREEHRHHGQGPGLGEELGDHVPPGQAPGRLPGPGSPRARRRWRSARAGAWETGRSPMESRV